MPNDPNATAAGANASDPPRSNVDSDLWAEAAALYERDTFDVLMLEARVKQETIRLKAAKKKRKQRQEHFSALGVPAQAIQKFAGERAMSEDERHMLYAQDAIGRRALGLWQSDQTFKRLMRRADATIAATSEAIEKIDGQRAYNDGFNSAAHGGSALGDNPNAAGTIKHAEWHRGCTAGMELRAAFEDPAIRPLVHGSAPSEPGNAPETETITRDVVTELGGEASDTSLEADDWPVVAKTPEAPAADAKAPRKRGQFQKKEAAPEPEPRPETTSGLFDGPIEMRPN
jgi:hypothetical protein